MRLYPRELVTRRLPWPVFVAVELSVTVVYYRVVASQLQKKYRAHEFTTDHTADISCCRPVYDGGPEVEEDAWSAVIERVGSHERTGVTVISTTGHVEIREGNKTHELCALI